VGVVLILMVTATACTGSDRSDDEPPSLDRIDGPAVVDPSFDPFATDPSAPPATVGG
jgi:hypothetical protein